MISDQDKTKEQLIAELAELRLKVNLARQPENTLQESEERYHSLVMCAGDAIYTINQQGRIISWNTGAETIYGYAAEDIMGQDFLSLIPEQYRGEHENILQGAMSAGVLNNITGPVEGLGRKKDGTTFPLESSLAMFNTRGINYCTVIVRDISERRQTEEALMQSEKQYRELVENVNSVILRFDSRGLIIFCNKFTEHLFGYSREELVSQSAGNAILPAIDSSGRNLAALLDDVIANPERYSRNENENICKDGRRLWMSWTNTAIRDENGNICEFLAVGNDITAQKQIKTALQESEEKYRTLLNDATDAIVLADDTGNIFESNKQAEALLGYTARELTGMNFADLHPEQERNTIVTRVKSSLLPQETWALNDVPLLKKDGTIVPADISGRFIEYAGKRVILGLVRDISERKAAEAELEKYRRHLEDLVAARTAELTALNAQLRQEIDERNKIEEALRKSEEQFRSVIEAASDAIVTTDSGGKILLWNKGAEIMFGYTAGEIFGQPFLKLVPEQIRGLHREAFSSVLSQRNKVTVPSHVSLNAIRKNGSEFPTEGSTYVWETREGTFVTTIIRDVSDRKRAGEALLESEERFRNLAQTAIDAIFLTDEDRHIIFWNKAAERIFGYTEKEVLGKISTFVVPEEQRVRDEDGYQNLLATGISPTIGKTFESMGRHKDGTPFPTEVSFSAWRAGGKGFYCVVARDITSRRAIESALRESEEKFRTMTEHLTASIFIYQGNNLVYVNPAAIKACGYAREELLSMNFWDIVHPDFMEQAREWGRRRQSGEELPPRYELKIKNKQGAERWIDYTAAAIHYNGDTAVLGTAIDITERKLAENALMQSEERYRLTAENIPIHLGVINQDRKFVLWNKYSEKMFGYTRDEVINTESPDLIIGGKGLTEELIRMAGDDGIYDGDLTLQKKDGSQFLGHLIVVPSKNADGLITGYYGFAEDITKRKRAEDLINKVNDCLLSFTADPDKNIRSIVEVAGTILSGASASYFHKQGDLLQIAFSWNPPAGHIYPPRISARVFNKLLASCGNSPLILPTSAVQPVLNKKSLMLQMGFKAFLAAPVKSEGNLIGSLNVAFKEAINFSPNELNIFSILAKAISIEEERKKVLEDLTQHQLRLKSSEKSLKAFSVRILSIREEEQKNISSALHDEIGSMVVAVSSGLAIAKEDITENNLEPALKSLERTEAALKQAVDNLKKIAIDLRPPNLDIVGLSNALKSFFSNVTRQTKISIDFSSTIDDNKIDETTAIVLYRTAQEGLNNIVKHAKANAVSIRLYEEKSSLLFEIADNGRGFNPESLTASSRGATKIGIQGMRERIAALGGAMQIESAPQKGTTLHITIPKRRGKKSWK